MSMKETFRKLVADYTGKPVVAIDLASDNHSTAIRAMIDGDEEPHFFLCIDRPPIGPRRPVLTAIDIEEVEFTSWPPKKTSHGSVMLVGL